MPVDIVALQEQLKTSILAAAVDATPALTVTAPGMPTSVNPPHLYFAEVDVEFDQAQNRGLDHITLHAKLLAGALTGSSSGDTSRILNRWCSGASGSGQPNLKTAIESGRRQGTDGRYAGNVAGDLVVTSVTGWGQYEYNGTDYLGAEFVIEVWG